MLPEGMDGIKVLRKVKEVNKDCICIGFTGYANYNVIRDWFNEGLYKLVDKNKPDYLTELTKYVGDAVDRIKEDFEWHSKLLVKIQEYESKVSQ